MASNTLKPITRRQVLAILALLAAIIFVGFIVDTSVDPFSLDPVNESPQ